MTDSRPSDEPLAVIRGRSHEPGSLGRVTPGGGWIFLLPTLEVRRVAVAGTLDAGATEQLHRLHAEVISGGTGRVARVEADLLVIAGFGGDPLQRPPLRQMVAATLEHGGQVYCERTSRGAPSVAVQPSTGAARYAASPPRGPVAVAAPGGDRQIAEWLAEHDLDAAAGAWEQRLESLTRRGRALGWRAGAGSAGSRRGSLSRTLRRAARSAVAGTTRLVATTERTWGRLSRSRRELLILGTADGSPRYLTEMARGSMEDTAGYRTALVAAGPFRTQKNLLLGFPPHAREPALITKVGRDDSINERLDAAVDVLRAIAARHLLPAGAYPPLAYVGEHAGLRFVGEEALAGERFESLTTATPACPRAARVVSLLTELAVASRCPIPAERVGRALQQLLDAAVRVGAVRRSDVPRLAAMISEVDAVDPFPCVVQHGDPGPWNIVTRADGSVALLDWENGELLGIPIWDLAYFARSFGALIARRRGSRERLEESLHLFRDPALRLAFGAWAGRYADALELPRSVVPPLVHLSLVYQALKEATRLPRGEAGRGIFSRTLVALLEDEALAADTFAGMSGR